MVDRKRIELFPKACKAPVLPLSLTAHLNILHQYIVFVKSKNQPYPIWIRFVRVRHTGVYRVPHAVGRFHPTRTLFYVRPLGGFMGIFNPQIISRTQPLVIVSDLAKFKPLPLSDIKTVQTMGIEPITADNLGSILSQRSHQIAASI
jgi:hypothetical protein